MLTNRANLCLREQDLTASRVSGILRVRINKTGKDSTTAKILRKCKKMAQIPALLCRRSFRAVGESCVINLIPDPKPIRRYPQPVLQVSAELGHTIGTLQCCRYDKKAPTTSGLYTKQWEGGRLCPKERELVRMGREVYLANAEGSPAETAKNVKR